MTSTPALKKPSGLTLMLGWRRVLFVVCFSGLVGLVLSSGWTTGVLSIVVRAVQLGLIAMLVFGVFEQWPRRLPRWIARWALQVVGVALVIPFATATIYALTTRPGAPHFWQVRERMVGFATLTSVGIFLAPWAALGALVRQKEALARHQALAFELERSELARQALDARLHLLQAQVAPHFLFNTLANVQALVDAGSPRASEVLRSLIAYLRAAVPQIREAATTFGHELELVRAYLELMHMRMPDRLQFSLHADDTALALRCPPMTLLTLVENAVRHGIDPSEDGGCIEVEVRRQGHRCRVVVTDTGVGLGRTGTSLGTGLSTLRERLQLVYQNDAYLRMSEVEPSGVRVELDLPVREESD